MEVYLHRIPIEDEKILEKINNPMYYKLKKTEVAQGIVLPQEFGSQKSYTKNQRQRNLILGTEFLYFHMKN